MQMTVKLPFTTLLLMISFAAVNAVLFTPALPKIAQFFSISEKIAQETVTWFLLGYALSQLLYGPLTARFGRRKALSIGILLQIISSFLCVISGWLHYFFILLIGRFLLALGAGVGLKMTFTLINENYNPKLASEKISHLLLAFAITPGLAIAIGGILTSHFGWQSCFYVCALYGLALLILSRKLPTEPNPADRSALKWNKLRANYKAQFKNLQLVGGAVMVGLSSAVIYVFSALSPFIGINIYKMTSTAFGIASILPPLGILIGSLISAKLLQWFSLYTLIKIGIGIMVVGTLILFMTLNSALPPLLSLFLPAIIVYSSLCFITANGSSIAMSRSENKSYASSVMNFINVGTAMVMQLSLGFFTSNLMLLPMVYMASCILLISIYMWVVRL